MSKPRDKARDSKPKKIKHSKSPQMLEAKPCIGPFRCIHAANSMQVGAKDCKKPEDFRERFVHCKTCSINRAHGNGQNGISRIHPLPQNYTECTPKNSIAKKNTQWPSNLPSDRPSKPTNLSKGFHKYVNGYSESAQELQPI